MLTTKPLLKAHFSLITGRVQAPRYRYTRKPKLSDRDTIRERYKKPSVRLRPVGSKEQTSVRLETWGKPTPGKTKHAGAFLFPIVSGNVTMYHPDAEVPKKHWPGIQYFANVHEFAATCPEHFELFAGAPMDAQFTVNHFDGKIYPTPTQKLDRIIIADGMPILLKDQ